MKAIVHSVQVQAPIERVFAVLTDIKGAPGNIPEIVKVEMRSGTGQPAAVGTTWLETRTMGGRTASLELTVTRLEPPALMAVACTAMGTRYLSTFTLATVADHTMLTLTTTAQPSGVVSALLARLVRSMMAEALHRDLLAIKQSCERPR
jgi:uncharacterized protein YndB with AHSA1/START domain